jgi:hypothetical protein
MKALQRLKERGEPISTYISTHRQRFTAIMVERVDRAPWLVDHARQEEDTTRFLPKILA